MRPKRVLSSRRTSDDHRHQQQPKQPLESGCLAPARPAADFQRSSHRRQVRQLPRAASPRLPSLHRCKVEDRATRPYREVASIHSSSQAGIACRRQGRCAAGLPVGHCRTALRATCCRVGAGYEAERPFALNKGGESRLARPGSKAVLPEPSLPAVADIVQLPTDALPAPHVLGGARMPKGRRVYGCSKCEKHRSSSCQRLQKRLRPYEARTNRFCCRHGPRHTEAMDWPATDQSQLNRGEFSHHRASQFHNRISPRILLPYATNCGEPDIQQGHLRDNALHGRSSRMATAERHYDAKLLEYPSRLPKPPQQLPDQPKLQPPFPELRDKLQSPLEYFQPVLSCPTS